MKRFLCAVLAVTLLLSGCGVIRDQNEAGEEIPASVLDMSSVTERGRMDTLAVYFLNTNNNTLTAEPRKLLIKQDRNPAEPALEALLAGPSNDSVAGVAREGMELDFIEYSNGVANVYINYYGPALQTEETYILEQAIANTVTDILGATSTCVFYNGVRHGFGGYPSAPLKKQTGNVHDAYLSAYGKYIPQQPDISLANTQENESDDTQPEETAPSTPSVIEIQTVLYFPSTSGEYILPEVRTVTYTPGRYVDGVFVEGNYIEAIISELKKGPQNTAVMKSPLVSDSALEYAPELSNGRLSLSFNMLSAGTSTETKLACAALIYSITGFVPHITSVSITADGVRLTGYAENMYGQRRSDYFGCVGSSAPIYFEDRNSDLLLEVSRSMEQSKVWSARARLDEMIRGPIESDSDNVSAVIRVGITRKDILDVIVNGDTAYVNLSENFKAVCEDLTEREERLLIYAMVNTVTGVDGISKVQFLVEGRQVDTLAGHICLTDPFLKNYGIIKNGG